MKFLASLFVLSLIFSPVSLADEWMEELKVYDESVAEEEALAPAASSVSPQKVEGTLVNLDPSRISNRLSDVIRRLDLLEKQNRLQEEQIRRLDRSVNDLKRRR